MVVAIRPLVPITTVSDPMETPKVDLLRRAMQAYAWRNQALSANIANLDTPDARRLTVSFEEELQRAMQSRDGNRARQVEARLSQETAPPLLEDELMELADTQMRTQFAARALSGHYDTMRMSISGRTG